MCDPPLDLVAGAGMEGCVEGLATFFADLPCRHHHRPPLLGLDVLDVQLWILGAKLNKRYRLQLFF